MNTLIYILKVSIILSVLYTVYYFLFRNIKHTKHNRYYLLFGLVVSFLIPILPVHQWFGTSPELRTPTQMINDLVIPISVNPGEVSGVISDNKDLAQSAPIMSEMTESTFPDRNSFRLNLIAIMFWVWISGMIAMLSRLFFNYFTLYCLYRKGQFVLNAPSNLKYNPAFPHAGSFFHWIFWPTPKYTTNQQIILNHESIHKNHFHSLDILLVEISKPFLWFLPVIYWWRKAVELNHEYMVDEQIAASNKELYLQTLSNSLSKPRHALTLSFASFVNQRITRINSVLKNNLWLSIFNLPVLFLVAYLFSSAYMGDQLNMFDENEKWTNEFSYSINEGWVGKLNSTIHKNQNKSTILLSDFQEIAKEEIGQITGKEIKIFYRNKPIHFSEDAMFRISYNSFKRIQEEGRTLRRKSETKGTTIVDAPSEFYADSIDPYDKHFTYSIIDSSNFIHFNLQFKIVSDKRNFILLDNHRIPISKSYIRTKEFVSEEIQSIPKEIYIDGKLKGILSYEQYLIQKDTVFKIESTNRSLNGHSVFGIIETPAREQYKFFYYLSDGGIDKPISIDKYSTQFANPFGKKFILSNLPLPIKFEEQIVRITWNDLQHNYYKSYPASYLDHHHFPKTISKENLISLLRTSPKIFLAEDLPRENVFMDLIHTPRQNLPKKYSFIYDVSENTIEHDPKILQILLSEIKSGDFIEVNNLRNQYSANDGFNWSFKIGEENDVYDQGLMRQNKDEVDNFMKINF